MWWANPKELHMELKYLKFCFKKLGGWHLRFISMLIGCWLVTDQHDWIKHVEVNLHFIKEKLDCGLVCNPNVSLERQLTAILIKGLTTQLFQSITNKLWMKNICSLALEGVLENWCNNFCLIICTIYLIYFL